MSDSTNDPDRGYAGGYNKYFLSGFSDNEIQILERHRTGSNADKIKANPTPVKGIHILELRQRQMLMVEVTSYVGEIVENGGVKKIYDVKELGSFVDGAVPRIWKNVPNYGNATDYTNVVGRVTKLQLVRIAGTSKNIIVVDNAAAASGETAVISLEDATAEVAAVDGLITIYCNTSVATLKDLEGNNILHSTFKSYGSYIKANLYVNGVKYPQIAKGIAIAPVAPHWGLDTTVGGEKFIMRLSAAGNSDNYTYSISMDGIHS